MWGTMGSLMDSVSSSLEARQMMRSVFARRAWSPASKYRF